jgi:hypothetical protein
MKHFHLALRLAQFRHRSEALTNSFSIHFARQTKVRAVAGLAWLMTMAVGLSAATPNGADGPATEITQFPYLRQNARTLLFQGRQ